MSQADLTCIALNEATEDDREGRVGTISDAKPNCACELEAFSRFSPGLVNDDEVIARVVCEPMHVHPKRLEVMPSFFSQAFKRGASAQRHDLAADGEYVDCIKTLLGTDEKKVWLGYVTASAKEIRSLMMNGEDRDYGVYDAALEHNPAHVEIHAARRIPEADEMVYRKQLRDLFLKSGFQPRKQLCEERVWSSLPADLKARPVPERWREFVG